MPGQTQAFSPPAMPDPVRFRPGQTEGWQRYAREHKCTLGGMVLTAVERELARSEWSKRLARRPTMELGDTEPQDRSRSRVSGSDPIALQKHALRASKSGPYSNGSGRTKLSAVAGCSGWVALLNLLQIEAGLPKGLTQVSLAFWRILGLAMQHTKNRLYLPAFWAAGFL